LQNRYERVTSPLSATATMGRDNPKGVPVKNHVALIGSTALACTSLALGASASPAATAATPLSVHQEPLAPRLLVPGDRVELDYKLESRVKRVVGVLHVRNDLMRRFVRLPLHVRGKGGTAKGGATLWTVVPKRLLRGRTLRYYATVRDPESGRVATTGKRSAWILEHPVTVKVGSHRFGQTSAPDAVVARARADEVSWEISPEFSLGPQTLNVASDGSVILQDSFANRLLVWDAGRPDSFSGVVPLPGFAGSGDVVPGPAGSFYVSAPGDWGYKAQIVRLSASGGTIWHTDVPDELSLPIPTAQLPLRIGPDGTLYCQVHSAGWGLLSGLEGWMPVTTPAGAPLSPAQQRRHIVWGYQPVSAGLRLVSEAFTPVVDTPAHEARLALVDRRGRVVRSWRVLSRDELGFPGSYSVPELVGGNPVVVLDVQRQAGEEFKWERVVLRLGPRGARAQLSLANATFGQRYYADLRVGRDGNLYQLATSPTTGVTISRYSLAPSS
jgi:hypothetical protein